MTLPVNFPTAVAFLDETGSIASDRFFAVGCLKLREPSILLRQLQKLRNRRSWHQEIHWAELTFKALPFYRDVVDLLARSDDAYFSCFIADRHEEDPLAKFRSPWKAYEKLATLLLLGSISNPEPELVPVLADNYSTPDNVHFERDVRAAVNDRRGYCTVPTVCRLDSKAADPLQLVDLMTSAVTFEFRQCAGLAGRSTPKAQLAAYVRHSYGIQSFLPLPLKTPQLYICKYATSNGKGNGTSSSAPRSLPDRPAPGLTADGKGSIFS
jgi:hypothetical protein